MLGHRWVAIFGGVEESEGRQRGFLRRYLSIVIFFKEICTSLKDLHRFIHC
ncbi:hypothetical protein KFK09_024779 [Dendrobium nobile]|uniref:Uncharacterized protein n=1 Tax=Dendrobium nobile TaxID=94219 RepID=A0A8T3AEQ9_DENNO|nr:hypothetical protein KFK09_024779 [Dendrobium nobile]